ncbi:MAG: alpha-amylase family glycosyl hydrolase [Metamycoplasmataceae bacterium]
MNELSKKIGYQIFPRSFKDGNNDGNGDIKGIIEKLDYLQDLGVDIIWLCPIYKTNFADAGYDVVNYYEIDPLFGTMNDFKELIKETKKRNMEIMMDVVLNHGSDLAFEFQEAKKSKDNPYHNFYIWNDKPNLEDESIFGGSAWEYVKEINSYYLHIFSKEQPDFNWDNPLLRKWIYKMLSFWIGLGVKYFRLDAIEHVGKTTNPYIIRYGKYNFEYLHEMYEEVFKNKDAFTVGESWSINPEIMAKYSNDNKKATDSFFNFSMLAFDWKNPFGSYAPIKNKPDFTELRGYFDWQDKPLLTCTGWTNHDTPRALERYLDVNENNYYFGQTLLSTFTLTTKGVPFLFQGEEIGMSSTLLNGEKDFRDGAFFQQLNNIVEKDKKLSYNDFIKGSKTGSRDLSRSLFSWSSQENSGFSKNKGWINSSWNYQNQNLEEDLKKEFSVFKYTKELIKIRKNKFDDIFTNFNNINLIKCEENLVFYKLENKNYEVIVLLNFNNKEIEIEKDFLNNEYELLLSNYKHLSKNNILNIYETKIFLKRRNK